MRKNNKDTNQIPHTWRDSRMDEKGPRKERAISVLRILNGVGLISGVTSTNKAHPKQKRVDGSESEKRVPAVKSSVGGMRRERGWRRGKNLRWMTGKRLSGFPVASDPARVTPFSKGQVTGLRSPMSRCFVSKPPGYRRCLKTPATEHDATLSTPRNGLAIQTDHMCSGCVLRRLD